MSRAKHVLQVDPPCAVIQSTLSGFFEVADVHAYALEAERAITDCASRTGHYRMLIDVSGCLIQSQAVIDAFAQHARRVPKAQRLAVVTSSAIVRMQIKRVLANPDVCVFESRRAGAEWLSGSERPTLQ